MSRKQQKIETATGYAAHIIMGVICGLVVGVVLMALGVI